MLTCFANAPFYGFSISTMHIIVSDNILYLFYSFFYHILIISSTILCKKIFEYIGRYRKSTFDKESQILADYHTLECC